MCDLWGQEILEGLSMYTHPSVSGTAGQNLIRETIFSHCCERRATAIRRRNLTTLSGYSLTAENGVAATGTRGATGAAAGGPVSQSNNGYEKKKTRCHRPLGESPLAQPRRYVTFTDTFACLEGTISLFWFLLSS